MNPLNQTILLDCIAEQKKDQRDEEAKYLRDKCRRLEQRIEYLEMQLLISQRYAVKERSRFSFHGV